MKVCTKRIGVILYYLLGVLFPPIATSVYLHFQEVYSTYLRGLSFFVMTMAIYASIGVYIAMHKIVADDRREKLWVSMLISSMYLFLAIFTDLIASNEWIYLSAAWIFHIDKFHIWTILFGYFFARSLVDFLKHIKKRNN